MADIALRQRSATELVDAAFQIYRRDPVQFILAGALIYVPWMVLRLALGIGLNGARPTMGTAFIAAIGGALVYTFAGGVTTLLASDVYFGRPTDLAGAFRTVATHIVPLILTMVISAFIIGFAAIFLLFPALYPLARFFGVRQVVVLEDGSTGQAFSRSSTLSDGTKRHILNTLLLIGLLVYAISLGAGLSYTLIHSQILQVTLGTALSAVLYPLFGITETLLYYDMRIRKEGFDVEYLASIGPVGGMPAAPAIPT